MRLWDARTGRPRGKPLTVYPGTMNALALGEVDGEPMVVVSRSDDETVGLLDLRTGLPCGEPLAGHTARVNAVALGEVDGEPTVVSGSDDTTVRLWDARANSLLRIAPLRSKVTGLAMGKGSEIAVSADRGLIVLDF